MANDSPQTMQCPDHYSKVSGKDALRFVICDGDGAGSRLLIERLLSASDVDSVDRVAGEPGGTIGVSYYRFATVNRNFIVGDTSYPPGHIQGWVKAMSTADVAVILIDARERLAIETRRQSYLVSLLGIRKVVVAVSNLEDAEYGRSVFNSIEREYREFATQLQIDELTFIPISVPNGENLPAQSASMHWYHGPTLIGYLDAVGVDHCPQSKPFRMLVDVVNRASNGPIRLSGLVVGGIVRVGDRLRVVPAGRESNVTLIATRDGDVDHGVTGQSITVTLGDDLDVRKDAMLGAADSPPGIADQFEATIIWMHEAEMFPGRSYLIQIGSKTVGATLATPKYKLNVDTGERLAARTLRLNEIGVCNVNLDQAVAFDPYVENRETGHFILIERATNRAIGTGLVHFALRRSQNIHWQAIEINKAAHAALNAQKPCVVWFTGLSGAGKSTIANLVEKRLHSLGRRTYLLDGDNVRHGLNKDLGFTEADRVENIRRVAEVARLMVDAGLIVLVSFISPFAAERRMARSLVAEGEFHEVFVDAPLAVAEQRDTKGLYRKARRGELKNFTGIDSPYERPEHAEIAIDTTRRTPEESAEAVLAYLDSKGILRP